MKFTALKIPIVYNTHGYETQEALSLADSFVDVWLTDLKFIDNALSKRYTSRPDYSDYALNAVRFMSQKPLKMRQDGKMLSGCIVRHLIMPLAVYDSINVVKFCCYVARGRVFEPYEPIYALREYI